MKFSSKRPLPLLIAVSFLAVTLNEFAQRTPVGSATDFTSESYYEPPHEQQVKMKLSGANASPLPGGLMEVKKLHIEMFSVEGKTQLIVSAPQCIYSPLDGVARSAGSFDLKTGDGKFQLEGEGFLWRQDDQSLTISNHVHTLIKSVNFALGAP